MSNPRRAPLDGVRVLDLSRVLAGPFCTQTLADLGADVIKVERPGTGDDTRAWGPPYLKDAQGNDTSESAYYISTNRNKRSIAVDLATPEGSAIVRELASQCDVLLENFKVGGLKQYGLDYDSLKDEMPRLIYCSLTGFGQTGPFANRPGYDFMIQGMGGLMSITGERDGLPGAGPQKAGVAVTDVFTGLYGVIAILGALRERDHSGLGQYIDLALLDCHVAMLSNQNLNYMTSGQAPQRAGNAHQNVVPYQVFKTADGFMILAVGNDSQFRAFCKVAGQEQWANDERFAKNSVRIINRQVLVPLIEQIMLERKRDDWIAALEAVGVPCGPIQTIDQVFDHPQVKARELWQNIPHPLAGTSPTTANPIRFSATPVQYRRPAPMLGEHTEEILREFGLKKD
ncbi:CaiB/BaiF CoA transferase family protein [Orrella daihaiensis]|uniref:CoA transferase n=1 Tax=Orrella daihaiensis TaxID=2782176 RepID=A0ABY4AI35_9BURK|nr:CaiB/BaiF CoA-transferase family protein [Orrella daihaiensis]UOD49949.1 CoA transferase [Orrella daihaiensis]